jgi:hypothetical protein
LRSAVVHGQLHPQYDCRPHTRGCHGGIGVIHALARQLGLIGAIKKRLHLLDIHLPFHESDQVLNAALNHGYASQLNS